MLVALGSKHRRWTPTALVARGDVGRDAGMETERRSSRLGARKPRALSLHGWWEKQMRQGKSISRRAALCVLRSAVSRTMADKLRRLTHASFLDVCQPHCPPPPARPPSQITGK